MRIKRWEEELNWSTHLKKLAKLKAALQVKRFLRADGLFRH